MSACSDLRPARWTMFTSHRDRKPQSVVSTGARDELCGKTSRAPVRCSSELGQGHFLKSIRSSILSHPGVDMFPFHIIPLSAAHETALRLFMQYHSQTERCQQWMQLKITTIQSDSTGQCCRHCVYYILYFMFRRNGESTVYHHKSPLSLHAKK